jgi:hypothetical protein
MELNQSFSINSISVHYNVQRRVSIFHSPSRILKLSNLQLNSYLPALTILNVIYLPKDESLKAQGPLQYKCASINGSFKIGATIPNVSKCVLVCPAVLCFRVGSLDELAMLLHQLHSQLMGPI